MPVTEDQMPHSLSLKKASREIPLTRQDELDLLEVNTLPGGEENRGMILGGLRRLIEQNGEAWVREYRTRLVEELKVLKDF